VEMQVRRIGDEDEAILGRNRQLNEIMLESSLLAATKHRAIMGEGNFLIATNRPVDSTAMASDQFTYDSTNRTTQAKSFLFCDILKSTFARAACEGQQCAPPIRPIRSHLFRAFCESMSAREVAQPQCRRIAWMIASIRGKSVNW
jgi:hypothetical protein